MNFSEAIRVVRQKALLSQEDFAKQLGVSHSTVNRCELYKDNEKVTTLLTQLNWSNHLKIMSACKTMEEHIFYMSMCVKEKYSARELARQIDSGYYERYMLSQKPLTPAIEELKRLKKILHWKMHYFHCV